MPQVLSNASVLFDTSDLSAFVKTVTIDQGVEELDQTAMGATTRINYPGLRTWGMEIEVFNNFASDSCDDVVSGFLGSTLTVSVKPTATAGDADNPEWSGLCFISAYNPVQGSVGDLAMSRISLSPAGALTRATATA